MLASSFLHFTQASRRGSLFFPLSLLFALALISYSPLDPSLNTSSSLDWPMQNWLGSFGALVSDLLVQVLGKGSWIFVIIICSLSVRSYRSVSVRTLCLFFSLCLSASAYALLDSAATSSWPAGSGGVLGEFIRTVAYNDDPRFNFAAVVAALIASAGLFFAAAPNLPRALYGTIGLLATLVSRRARELRAASDRISKDIREEIRREEIREEKREETRDTSLRREVSEPQLADTEFSSDDEVAAASADDAPTDDAPLLLRDPVHSSFVRTEQEESSHDEDSISAPSESRAKDKAGLRRANDASAELPPLSLLSAPSDSSQGEQTDDELRRTSELLERTLGDYGVRGTITEVQCGPVITLYALEPAAGVKASRVISLADDIARTMRRISVRIAVIPGKNGIGIELPNPARQTVVLGELLTTGTGTEFLPLALGKNIDGTAQVVDLADMPHLLIAGTTGAGKSVGINAMILSLLYRHTPETCRLILIDPKMLELSAYQDIPHLLTPVITDSEKALSALRWASLEMERRYSLMASVGVRNIDGYRRKRKQQGKTSAMGEPLENLPYIVLVVDEMADLMLTNGRNIEMVLQRLAQMARAAGIHMIVATQRPSVDVITGTIKANFPTRISYRVASKFDSRTILNEQGAEMLLGRGDMLFMPCGGKITRIHGPYVGEEEVEAVCDFLRAQRPPNYVSEILETTSKSTAANPEGVEDEDPLYAQALAIVAKHQRASTSFLQRQLQIGYNRAARIIERMEEEGHVGGADATGKRSISLQAPAKTP